MTKNILLDTDIIIDFSKGKSPILKRYLELQSSGSLQLYISSIILIEFFTDSQLNNLTKLRQAETFFKFFKFIPLDRQTSLKAAEILRLHQSDFLADACIAATCLVHQLSLLTRNHAHFSKIPQLHLID